jgi:hypothetical protein
MDQLNIDYCILMNYQQIINDKINRTNKINDILQKYSFSEYDNNNCRINRLRRVIKMIEKRKNKNKKFIKHKFPLKANGKLRGSNGKFIKSTNNYNPVNAIDENNDFLHDWLFT